MRISYISPHSAVFANDVSGENKPRGWLTHL